MEKQVKALRPLCQAPRGGAGRLAWFPEHPPPGQAPHWASATCLPGPEVPEAEGLGSSPGRPWALLGTPCSWAPGGHLHITPLGPAEALPLAHPAPSRLPCLRPGPLRSAQPDTHVCLFPQIFPNLFHVLSPCSAWGLQRPRLLRPRFVVCEWGGGGCEPDRPPWVGALHPPSTVTSTVSSLVSAPPPTPGRRREQGKSDMFSVGPSGLMCPHWTGWLPRRRCRGGCPDSGSPSRAPPGGPPSADSSPQPKSADSQTWQHGDSGPCPHVRAARLAGNRSQRSDGEPPRFPAPTRPGAEGWAPERH